VGAAKWMGLENDGTMTTFERAPSLTLSDYLVREISRKILVGELRPGQRLQEAAIAQQTGVSRGPVREALRALQEQGLVTYAPNRGMWVTELSIEDIQEVLDVRAILEGSAARLAAPRLGEAEFAALVAIVARMSGVADHGPPMDLIHLDLEFHHTLSAASGNSRLMQMIASLSIQSRPHMAAGHLLGDDPHLIPRAHQQLLDALRMRDADEVERAVREHIYGFGRLFIERLREQRQSGVTSA